MVSLAGDSQVLRKGHRFMVGDYVIGLEAITKDGDAALRIDHVHDKKTFTKSLGPDLKVLTARDRI